MFGFKAPTVAPGDVRAVAINSSSISVDWRKPNKSVLHGMLRRYEIQYRRVECNESDPVSVPSNTTWNLVILSNTSSSKVIDGLVFWSCYELRMRAVTIGNGPFSDVQQVRTKEDGKVLFYLYVSVSGMFPVEKAMGLFCSRYRLLWSKVHV